VRTVFVADDFGTSREVNRAIVQAYAAGALDGASLMMGQPATADAIRQARAHPGLQVGLHVHLADSVPTTRESWPWGASPVRAGWAIGLDRGARRLIRREIETQWRLFQETGLRCSFINGHHHLHAHPMVYAPLMETVRDGFDGWVRLGAVRRFGPGRARGRARGFEFAALRALCAHRRRGCSFDSSDTLWGLDRLFGMNAEEVRSACAGLGAGLHEFLFHPRRVENDRDGECLRALRSMKEIGWAERGAGA
jgi:predicted glycoside hydrolase/deacetylase ChbG (UPF0249 family)